MSEVFCDEMRLVKKNSPSRLVFRASRFPVQRLCLNHKPARRVIDFIPLRLRSSEVDITLYPYPLLHTDINTVRS